MEARFTKQALKDLSKVPARDRMRIVEAVEAAARGDANADVKRLVGQDGIRIRAGNWRALGVIVGDVLEVRRVAPRGDVYKR